MQWFLESIGLTATALGILGVIANNRKVRACFVLWMVSNAMTLCIHAHAGIWSLAFRDVVFLLLAVEGWRLWGRSTYEQECRKCRNSNEKGGSHGCDTTEPGSGGSDGG